MILRQRKGIDLRLNPGDELACFLVDVVLEQTRIWGAALLAGPKSRFKYLYLACARTASMCSSNWEDPEVGIGKGLGFCCL